MHDARRRLTYLSYRGIFGCLLGEIFLRHIHMGSVVLGRFRCVILISDLTFRESHLRTHEIVALMDARLCTIQLILCNVVTRASQLSLRFFINLNIFMCGMLRFLVSGDHGM